MSSTQQIEATTTVTSDKCKYTWTIKNFSLIKTEVGESISSPKFCIGSDDKQFFKLDLYPEGKESAGFISLFLTYQGTDSTKKPDKLLCKSTIRALNGRIVVSSYMIHQDFVKTPTVGQLQFLELQKNVQFISLKNTVTIDCNIEVFKAYESLLDSKIIKNEDETNNRVKFNLLFLSEEFSDVELITSDKNSIPAHKVILAMASPVFKAMFTTDMLENKKNYVEITDTSQNVLVEMLRYIYTGDIESTSKDLILELLAVANKYLIDDLKIKCVNLLYADLSTRNAIDILIAAHKYDEKNLEDRVLNFIAGNIQLLVDSEQLNQIADPAILLKIIKLITKLPRQNASEAIIPPRISGFRNHQLYK